jgi:hypothetical protein
LEVDDGKNQEDRQDEVLRCKGEVCIDIEEGAHLSCSSTVGQQKPGDPPTRFQTCPSSFTRRSMLNCEGSDQFRLMQLDYKESKFDVKSKQYHSEGLTVL